MPGAGRSVHRRLDRREGLADRLGVGEVQLHAADVGLVRDGLGMQLQHDREADSRRDGDGLVFGRGDAGLDRRDAVGGEELLGLELGQQRPARRARTASSTSSPARWRAVRVAGRQARASRRAPRRL